MQKCEKKDSGSQSSLAEWLSFSPICKSSTNHMSCPHQPNFDHQPWVFFTIPSGGQKDEPSWWPCGPTPPSVASGNIWSGRKEIIAGNASALMAHAAANLTYIIHEASESEQQHMFPHDARGLEEQRCESTPLRSDGNFFPLISDPKWVSKQGTGCVMPPGGVGPTEIIYTDIT